MRLFSLISGIERTQLSYSSWEGLSGSLLFLAYRLHGPNPKQG